MEEDMRAAKVIMKLSDRKCMLICYNEDMIEYYERMVKELRGTDYFNDNVKVVAQNKTTQQHYYGPNDVYFTPDLLKLRGNGYG